MASLRESNSELSKQLEAAQRAMRTHDTLRCAKKSPASPLKGPQTQITPLYIFLKSVRCALMTQSDLVTDSVTVGNGCALMTQIDLLSASKVSSHEVICYE